MTVFSCVACGYRQEHVNHDLNNRLNRLEAIGRAIYRELGKDMSELDDKLAGIEASEATLEADETRELADLQALQTAGQTLTADQEARLDALNAKIQADDAAINTADPAPAAPAE